MPRTASAARLSPAFRWMVLAFALAFFALTASAARHLHNSTEAEIHCAVCDAVLGQVDGLAPVLPQPQPTYVLLYAVRAATALPPPRAAVLPVPPSCGPPLTT